MRSSHGWLVPLVGLSFLVLPWTAFGQSRNAEHYLFLAQKGAKVSQGSLVSGNMGVNDPGGRLNLSKGSMLADGTQVVADQVDMRAGSRAFDVFRNSGQQAGSIDGTLTQPIPAPTYSPEALVMPVPFDQANFPPAFPVTCGGPSRDGAQRETFTLAPGTYDTVNVGIGGKVILPSGTYNFCSLRAIKKGGIEVTAPATINIRDQIRVGGSSSLIPFGNPSNIQLNVQGKVVRLGPSSTFNARVFAPQATLRLGREALVTGHFVARSIAMDKGIRAFTCGNGMLDPGEQCDVTAPNGDAACPGQCAIPGSPNECQCPTPPSTTTSTSPSTSSTTTSSTSTTTPTTVPNTVPTSTTTSTTAPSTTTSTEAPTTTTSQTITTSTTVTTETTTTAPTTTTTEATTTSTTTTEVPTTTTTQTTTTSTTTATQTTTTSTTAAPTTTTAQATTTTSTTAAPTTTTAQATTTTSTTAAPTTTPTSTTTTTTTGTATTTTLPVPCTPQPTEIDSNFNGTPIRKNDFIWFNSALKVDGLPSSQPVTIRFDNSAIDFTAAGNPYHLVVPNAEITFSPTATLATTTFNTATNTWETTLPSTGLAGNDWLTGLAFQAPVDLPGGINPVSWSGTFSSDTPGLTIHWTWAAAVYTTFSTDYNSLGVKPVDDNNASIYHNSDHAGTPENFKAFVIGGARGGGGSNFTGSLSATVAVTCP